MSGILKHTDAGLTQAASSEITSTARIFVTTGVGTSPVTKYLDGETLKEVIRDEFGDVFLTAGTGISVSHDDVGNTFTISVSGVLEDLVTLGAPSADGEFIVATGAGAFAYESGATARASLGLVIGTNVQAWDANLDQLAALTPASSLIIGNGLGGYEMVTPANFITNNNILDTGDIGVSVQAYDADLAAIASLSSADGNFIVGSATGWVAESGATARTSLGLGNVENTALSTWAGSTNITTLGTIATGTWQGTAIANAYVAGIDQNLLTSSSPTFAGLSVGTLTLASGSITDSGGAISFGNENLSTTGTISFGSSLVFESDGQGLNGVRANNFDLELYSAANINLYIDTNNNSVGYLRVHSDVAAGGSSLIFEMDDSGNIDAQSGSITTTGTLASGAATVNGGATSIGLTLAGGLLATSNDYAWFRKNGNTSGRTHRVQTLFQRSDGTVIARHGTDISGADTETYQILVGTGSTPQYTFTSSGATVTGTLDVTSDVTLSAGDLGVGVAPTLGKVHVQQDVNTSAGGLTLVDTAVGTTLRAWSAGGNLVQINSQAAGTGTIALNDGGGSVVLGSTSTSNNAQFYATKTYSNASGTDIGAYVYSKQSVASTGGLVALDGVAETTHTSGTVVTLIGVQGLAQASGAGGTVTNVYGGFFKARNLNATATVTNAVGIYLDTNDKSGTVTNSWGIYQEGSADSNYLAGDLRIGTTSAAGNEILRVNGLIHSDSDSIIVDTAKTPATASATGTQGQIAWDADYIYVCTATDTWKRAAILTWV